MIEYEYIYLVESKVNGEKFILYGDFKVPGIRPKHLFQFAPLDYIYGIDSPYGRVMNISSDYTYDSKHYRVIHQTRIPFK